MSFHDLTPTLTRNESFYHSAYKAILSSTFLFIEAAMGIPTSILVVLFALLFIGTGLEFCSSTRSIDSNVSCIQSEREALVKFKRSLIDQSSRLSSWVGEDCCSWNGVGCSKTTGHVLKLDLRNPTSFQFDRDFPAYYFNDTNYSRTCLGGEYLCNIETLEVIDLSRNQLSGRLPGCLGDLQELEVLDLTNNSLDGDIPSSLGSLSQLNSLHLHNNRFHGKLPFSLQNLTNLKLLDLGENEFVGIIPPWIGEQLSNLKFLNLQSNKFNGDIPIQLCRLSTLQLLNLAQNNITGNIPHCFRNFTAMVVNHDAEEYIEYGLEQQYKENILDSMKGRELEYTRTIQFLTSIDLSNNHIVGEIPEELMDLFGLRSLNLAGNHLKGRIPEKIGNLKQLETLDFSRNKLFGSIPPSLSALHYLSRLNLSFNNLSGRIPTGNQLQTLDDQSIYIGNDGLCGLPLLKSCPGDKSYDDHKHVSENKGGEESEYLWFFYAGIGPGFLVGFLGFCGILHFKKSWRYAFFQLVDNIYNRLVVAIEVKATWVRRKFHKGEFRA